MHIVRVNLKERSYNIVIGENAIKQLGRYIKKSRIGEDAYVITTAPVKNRFERLLSRTLKDAGINSKIKSVADTEKSKSMETAASVIKELIKFDRKRKVFIIAFGGGVVGDLAGFVASIYKRGIPYIQVPTTLLAQVDSAIGGKTAVDLFEGKNLLGAFYQPRLVVSDMKFLHTLNLKQMRSGLAEVIKYGVIKDRRLFSFIENKHKDILGCKKSALEYIVRRCSAIKAGIVERDEKETKGIRTILNFGHTVGHAIEAASGYQSYTHGEAIALGMLVACDISRKMNLAGSQACRRLEDLIIKTGLAVKIKGVSLQKIINAHYRDKKFIGPRNKFVLMRGIGRVDIVENIPLDLIKGSIRERIKERF